MSDSKNKVGDDAKEQQRVEVLKAFRELDWLMQFEIIAAQAKAARMKYNAARKEGFEVAQSLELCIKPWSL